MITILGIDPGSRYTGYGIIQTNFSKLAYLDSGCIKATSSDLSQRLWQIFEGVQQLMQYYQPTEVAIEQVFVHRNPSSALKLGHARGVAMVAAAAHQVKIYEYSPREVKQAVVGFGGAEKEQVKQMVIKLLQLNSAPQADAADALAVAICHGHINRVISKLTMKEFY